MKIIKILSLVLLTLCLPAMVTGQTKVGTSAANFLQIGVGARGAALGEAAVSNGNDISSIYWNPALMANVPKNQAYFNHIAWFADIDLNYGAALLNLGNLGNFAVSFYSLNTDQMKVTTEIYPEGTGELFTVQDIMVGISYGRSLTDRFNIGGTVKMIRSTIWNTSASAFAFDVGLTYQTPFKPLNLGMSISNFGTEMRMLGTDTAVRYDPDPLVNGNNDGIVADQHTRSWDLPILFRFGLAYDVLVTNNQSIMIASDVLYPSSNDNYVNAGIEYGLLGKYFLRAGYRQLFLNEAEGGLTFGAGVNILNFHVDYALSDRGRLNSVQYFSLGIDF